MKDVTLTISGMSCGHCLNAVSQALQNAPGVQVRSVQMGRAELTIDEAVTSADAVATAVDEAGYHAEVGSAG